MNNICDIFNECSGNILNWLTKQPEVKEESMTDRFLFEISEKLPTIKYKQFSRMEEGRKTGADWEWWILFPNDNAFCARIQAKKIKSDKDNYASVAYTTNGMLQIEKLLDDSKKDDFASFYVFYSTESPQFTLCNRLSNGGVFISDAQNLKNEIIDKPRAKILAKDILKHSTPISCLFCCPLSMNNSYDGLLEYLYSYFPNSYEGGNSKKLQGFVKTPNSILQFIKMKDSNLWEIEYQRNLENTNALLVIDLRNQ